MGTYISISVGEASSSGAFGARWSGGEGTDSDCEISAGSTTGECIAYS